MSEMKYEDLIEAVTAEYRADIAAIERVMALERKLTAEFELNDFDDDEENDFAPAAKAAPKRELPNGFKDLEPEDEPDEAEYHSAEPEIPYRPRQDEIAEFVQQNPGLSAADVARRMVDEKRTSSTKVGIQSVVSNMVRSGKLMRMENYKLFPPGTQTTAEYLAETEETEDEELNEPEAIAADEPEEELEPIDAEDDEPELPPPEIPRPTVRAGSQIEAFERRLSKKQADAFPDRQPSSPGGCLDLICEFIRENGAASVGQISDAVIVPEHIVQKTIDSKLTMFVPNGKDKWDLHPNMRGLGGR